ncbi:MAG: hypothetical protein L6R38_004862 [Xanthoria sp. 2 TBL-2021]|nr:MAG: hypothetical protein L6R38_004862 [Xanthoria sp. 2 TBL-2021]
MCTILILGDPSIETAVTPFPSGWSSNDIIQVSTNQNNFIVKIPRQPSLPNAAARCKAEAIRTAWAANRGFGPRLLYIDPESGGFAMERLRGQTLTVETIKQRLPQVVRLLRRIYTARPAKWMWRFDPANGVKTMLETVKSTNAMQPSEVRLIEEIISNTAEMVKDHPWVLCHNDFHSYNIFLQPAKTRFCTENLMAIDFEECDLGDPMWDLAYLIVSLELEHDPYDLEDLYDATLRERRRVQAYIPLAMIYCATWAAVRGGPWERHCKELMGRLNGLVGGT